MRKALPLILLLGSQLVSAVPASGNDRVVKLQELRASFPGQLAASWNPHTGAPRHISGTGILLPSPPTGEESAAGPCNGGPEVPSSSGSIAIPPEGEVRAEVDESSSITIKLSGYRVYPAQPYFPAPDTGFVYDEQVYSTDTFFPEEIIWFGNIGTVRGLRIMGVEVNPVYFNPARGELLVHTSGRIIVEHDGATGSTADFNPGPFENSLRRAVFNYEWISYLGYTLESAAVSVESWGSIKSLF